VTPVGALRDVTRAEPAPKREPVASTAVSGANFETAQITVIHWAVLLSGGPGPGDGAILIWPIAKHDRPRTMGGPATRFAPALDRYVLFERRAGEMRHMNRRNEERETLAISPDLFDRRDRENVRNYVSFVVGSVRRHRLFFAAVFVLIMGSTVGWLLAFPKSYHVETKALAQTNSALMVRGDGPGADSLTRVAAETVLRRDNLLALIQQTDLLRYTTEHRAPAQRARDAIVKALHGQDSESDQLDALVEQLEKKLSVWTSESGSTVTIAIDWSDGPMACRLVDAAQRAFLDARYAREITALAESIAILGGHTTSLKGDIDDAVGGIERMRAAMDVPKADGDVSASPRPRTPSTQHPVAAAAGARVPGPSPELRQRRAQLDATVRAIDDLEEGRRHRLSELQGQLVEARTTFTENHPAIVALKQSIAALSVESPQVKSLRQDAASSKAEYDRISGSAGDAQTLATASTPAFNGLSLGVVATPPPLASDVMRIALDLRDDRDPGMVYARGQLRDAMDKYAALRTQIQTAQIDLETAQAAFKYRYSVVTPAHLPRSPTNPNVPLAVLAALVAAILCGLLGVVIADVRTGRLLERWQIERLLDLPILGEIVVPRLEEQTFE
jgi:uncharacterized protein involved in exopolysaccharide biosynthesis